MEIIPKESQDATEIEVFFEVPEEDGYYNETINIEWEAIPKSERAIAAPSFTRVTFYYRVKNGCIDFIDIDSTKRKCFRKKNVTGFINGKHVQLTDWNGYMDEATDIANESGIRFLLKENADDELDINSNTIKADEIQLKTTEWATQKLEQEVPIEATSSTTTTLTYCLRLQTRKDLGHGTVLLTM